MIRCGPAFIIAILILISGIEVVDAKCKDLLPDGTCCDNTINLQESNRIMLAAPAIVDFSESTGNILIRVPLPLIVRNGPGDSGNCMNANEWHFAYDELSQMLQKTKTFSPYYITGSKRDALLADMQAFDPANYHLIDISLLNAGDSNQAFFAVEKGAFGGNFSVCSGSPLQQGSIRGTDANLIWSNTIGCSPGDTACLNERLLTNDGGFCSFADTVSNLTALLNTKDPSGKKRLIYYHCRHGSDRTGGVTIVYLVRAIPGMTFPHALTYTTYLGKVSGSPTWKPDPDNIALANAYCNYISGQCSMTEGNRIYLPGRATHSHVPGQEDPVVTVKPDSTPANRNRGR